MIGVGSKVSILVAGTFSPHATHEVTGERQNYGWYICPLGKLDEIEQGQTHVPVTSITEDNLAERPVAVVA